MSGRAERMHLVRKLRKQGFVVQRTGTGHWKAFHPNGGQAVIMAFSPNSTADHKTRKRLESIGFKG